MSRLREKAADLLSDALGENVEPDEIEVVSGYWKQVDVYRWEVWIHNRGSKPSMHFGCWETLTEFVRLASRFGVKIDRKQGEVSAYEKQTDAELHAKPTRGAGGGNLARRPQKNEQKAS